MEPQDGSEEGFGALFYAMLVIGIIGIVGFFAVAAGGANFW